VLQTSLFRTRLACSKQMGLCGRGAHASFTSLSLHFLSPVRTNTISLVHNKSVIKLIVIYELCCIPGSHSGDWDVAPCSLAFQQRFGAKYCLRQQNGSVTQAINCCLLLAVCFAYSSALGMKSGEILLDYIAP
jgi:hypothetical protein